MTTQLKSSLNFLYISGILYKSWNTIRINLIKYKSKTFFFFFAQLLLNNNLCIQIVAYQLETIHNIRKITQCLQKKKKKTTI